MVNIVGIDPDTKAQIKVNGVRRLHVDDRWKEVI